MLRLVTRDLDRGPEQRPADRRRADARRSDRHGVRLDHGDDELSEVHEINVTPFIDVMLVLLIIFMVAAPLSTVDIPVDLPVSSAERSRGPTSRCS